MPPSIVKNLRDDFARLSRRGWRWRPAVGRQDRTRTAQLNLDWSPLRALVITGSLQRDTRSTNQANLDFEANAASITAQFSF